MRDAVGIDPDRKFRLLILEDNPADAELMEMALRRDDLRFLSKRVGSKQDFLAALSQFAPDLILADYNLPDYDGLSALETARKLHPHLPVIIVSGILGDDLAVETLRRGATDYVLKDKLGRLGSTARRALEESADRSLRMKAEERLRETLCRVRETLNSTVRTIGLLAEVRDPYTAGHQRRVAQLSCSIAREMGCDEDLISGLQIMAAIHDIGKTAVPSDILSKPCSLSENEFAIVKTHPRVAFDILKELDFAWPVAEAVYQHHERLDGSGYPRGLRSGEIMLQARVLAVADVVEAMSSHRPYRPALGVDRALSEIEEHKGVRYDVPVVEACLRLFREQDFQLEQAV